MKDQQPDPSISNGRVASAAALSAGLMWLAQPPLAAWPFALVALVPMTALVASAKAPSKRGYAWLWLAWTIYWLVSLQGLRLAHWAMYFCWVLLAGYLAAYPLVFLITARVLRRRLPLFLSISVAWTGLECLRGYLLTGISACLLGHTLADVPVAIQIADLFGTYGVSFVIAAINAAAYRALRAATQRSWNVEGWVDVVAASVLLGLTLWYGTVALAFPLGEPIGTFALVQRSEVVEYAQELDREVEMFRNYAADTLQAVQQHDGPIDAIVWPESMFTAGNPWMIADPDAVPPRRADAQASLLTPEDLQQGVQESREYFRQRASYLLDAIDAFRPGEASPHLIVGSGVVHYRRVPEVYCGVVHVSPERQVVDWYGKTHLVMFGEYIPIVPHIPGLRALVPPELGLRTGAGPLAMKVGTALVSPNICIETAVERVTVDQLRTLRRSGTPADVVVTVTNDGWFDRSSVIDHHRRSAQLVAVGIRRPILSAANNGPTVWIDSRGQTVQSIPTGASGVIMARPQRDARSSLYLQIGDWPARICAIACLVAIAVAWKKRRGGLEITAT
jgi:apolipoprotein N-acyltransferase